MKRNSLLRTLRLGATLGLAASLATVSYSVASASEKEASASEKESDGSIKRVLLLSVDGMHALDLANFIEANPDSTFAELAQHGVRYSDASTANPSDSFPGILAPTTGGSPNSTGVWYDDSYDRQLSPPLTLGGDKGCSIIGTEVIYDESIDKNSAILSGGGGINEDALPRDPFNGCAPVYPHSFLRVNTIFEVARQHGKVTAWSDKHQAYDLLNGPSGKGVTDLYSPEVASNNSAATASVANAIAYDDIKVKAVLNWINGKNHSGGPLGVPTIFGSNFQEVSVGQKVVSGGYINETGTPSNDLNKALHHMDESIGKMVAELKAKGLYETTLIVLSPKHGQSPINKGQLQTKNTGIVVPASLLGSSVAQSTTDDIDLIWLTDQADTDADADLIAAAAKSTQAAKIFSGNSLKLRFNDPLSDSRVPDIIVQPNLGVIYTGSTKKIAEHGGFSEDDTNVGLLVSNPRLNAAVIKEPVTTMQVAPTILKSLGFDPRELQAVRIEKTAALPGLSSVYQR